MMKDDDDAKADVAAADPSPNEIRGLVRDNFEEIQSNVGLLAKRASCWRNVAIALGSAWLASMIFLFFPWGEGSQQQQESNIPSLDHAAVVEPPHYPCLKNTMHFDMPEGSWSDDGASFTMNGTTSSLTPESLWRKQVNFMLIGCPKCGTTSTCEYLLQHPRIMRPYGKETQCLFARWNESDPYCEHWYNIEWLRARPDFISGDMTPEYLFRTELIIPRALVAFPWAKLIAIFRDPIERAYSEYRMKAANNAPDFYGETFEERVRMDLEHFQKAGLLLPYYRFARGEVKERTVLTWEEWTTAQIDMDAFEAFHGSDAEMQAWIKYQEIGSNGILGRGMYRMELTRWMMEFPCERFLVLKMEDYEKDDGVENNLMRLHQHLGLDYKPLASDEAKNTRHTQSDIQPDTRAFLERFFGPYNDRLHVILGDEWIDPW